ncbi:MAG: hypothetical protein HY823_15495 [Acidobacteria bacterium]|nr:hypothetical protein [Acidobacteriota bacterium]
MAVIGLSPWLGCYRATGIQRPAALASEIPAVGGDKVLGLKAQAGPGDYFLGNDFVELTVDGSPFGEREALAGAPGGGSVVDVGYVGLNTSYQRVSVPSDSLDRMTPVLNQDPDISLVMDRFVPVNTADESRIEMSGRVHDPKHKLTGASWDGQNLVAGLKVSHSIRLGTRDRYFTLETTVTNASGASLPVRNLGDHVFQQGGGFRFLIPATEDLNGQAISGWGVELPGCDWSSPMGSSVKSHLVVLMANEPGADTMDSHVSLGLLPLDGDRLAVASDPQHALTETRPTPPGRLVAGSLPGSSLAPNASLTYKRRLYATGGTSTSGTIPNQATGVLNAMEFDRATLRGWDYGAVGFQAGGSAAKNGPLQAEIRFDRFLGGDVWRLERVEWLEPRENAPVYSTDSSSLTIILPVGTYRVTARNRFEATVMTQFTNVYNSDRPDLATPLLVEKEKTFQVNETIFPERQRTQNATGGFNTLGFTSQSFTARERDGIDGQFQPLRWTFRGTGATPDPDMRRRRSLGGAFDPVSKGKVVAGANYAAYQFAGGNILFGSTFPSFAAGNFILPLGTFEALATRGPLSRLDAFSLRSFDGAAYADTAHNLVVFPTPHPAGWTSFDLPGPSQATTGGLNPAEMLSSALAETVPVVGCTETDLHIDPMALHDAFRFEFTFEGTTDAQRTTVQNDPFVVGGRSSDLADGSGKAWGPVTALWPPNRTNARSGGALPSKGWSLADFLTQAQGKFVVVHRPRGPSGLFTLRGFDPAVPLGSGVNAWWNQTGPLSQGRTHGGFDALELLRAEGLDPANPGPWFTEFKAVRRDWFALLSQQRPESFTKGLGLSAARYSQDTPVGLARTYLNLPSGSPALSQSDLSSVLGALQKGAAVASTGPLLDVKLGAVGPGGLATAAGTVSLSVSLYAPDWVPVDELRVVVNGSVVLTVDPASLTPGPDWRQRSGTLSVTLPAKDCWIVVEAGVPLTATGPYLPGSPWNKIQRGIYPIAVTNPIFVDVNGGGYTPPGL